MSKVYLKASGHQQQPALVSYLPGGIRRYCPECKVGRGVCSICRETGVVGQNVYKCKMGCCGHYLHYRCLKAIDAAGEYLKIHRYVHEILAAVASCAGKIVSRGVYHHEENRFTA